jgi:hypothetical protein
LPWEEALEMASLHWVWREWWWPTFFDSSSLLGLALSLNGVVVPFPGHICSVVPFEVSLQSCRGVIMTVKNLMQGVELVMQEPWRPKVWKHTKIPLTKHHDILSRLSPWHCLFYF